MAIERIEDITNTHDRELVTFLQDVVRIPSWVPGDEALRVVQNENGVVDYLERWILSNTNMSVSRQALDGGRYNLIAARGEADLVFLGHSDTVQPSGDDDSQLQAEIRDGAVWGRGTTDMKSGLVTMLQALQLAPDADNVWMFIYADEEYDFLGMKALVEDYATLRPKLLVSSDGSDLRFGHGCRGLIEFRGRFVGKTGHPARGTGVSATMEGWEALRELRTYVKSINHPIMGPSSYNVSHVKGGARLPDSLDENGHLLRVGEAGNVVSDIMDFVVDIRPASPDLSINGAIHYLDDAAREHGLKLEIIEKTHQYGAWYTNLEDVREFADVAKNALGVADIEFDDPGGSGYLDLQMFWDATGRPPAFMFGGGVGDTAHTPVEHIRIEDMIKERNVFLEILRNHQKNG